MTARFWTNVRRTAGLALALLTVTAGASNAASFDRVAQAPGGEELAVIKGVPYIAHAQADGVHVWKLTRGNVWQPVGTPVRHKSGDPVHSPSLTGDPNGVPWLAWTETDSSDTAQARVARFVSGSWKEVVGGDRPINRSANPPDVPDSALDPQIVFFEGRPYVGYIQDTLAEFTLDAVRLSSDGSQWEHIKPPSSSRPSTPRIAVSGAHLYLAAEAVFGPGIFFYRLNDAGTAWDPVGDAGRYRRLGDLADLAGAPVVGYYGDPADGTEFGLRAETLGPDDHWNQLGSTAAISSGPDDPITPKGVAVDGSVPYVSALRGADGSRELIVSRFVGGAWEAIDSPSDPGADATAALLAPGSTGGIWLLFGQTSGGTTRYYLDSLGAKLPAGSNPPGPPEPPTGPPTGLCSNEIDGSRFGDRLNGTRRSDAIFGWAGNDRIRGFGASDCLYGGKGNDSLFGGRGNDFFRGNAGNDHIRGDSGNDDINGDRGNDRIVGGSGSDEINAGPGNDTIYVARDGGDLVECGAGRDTVVITLEDRYRNCESVVIRR